MTTSKLWGRSGTKGSLNFWLVPLELREENLETTEKLNKSSRPINLLAMPKLTNSLSIVFSVDLCFLKELLHHAFSFDVHSEGAEKNIVAAPNIRRLLPLPQNVMSLRKLQLRCNLSLTSYDPAPSGVRVQRSLVSRSAPNHRAPPCRCRASS